MTSAMGSGPGHVTTPIKSQLRQHLQRHMTAGASPTSSPKSQPTSPENELQPPRQTPSSFAAPTLESPESQQIEQPPLATGKGGQARRILTEKNPNR
jgi:hypothetical protein